MTATELAAANGLVLRDDVLAALAPLPEPEPEPIPPPSLLERSIGAREDGEPDRAAALFEEALAANPDDVETWQAYADSLTYELDDFDGARGAPGGVARPSGRGESPLQRSLPRRNGKVEVEITTVDRVETVGVESDLDVKISRLSTTHARHTLACQPNFLAFLKTLRNPDLQRMLFVHQPAPGIPLRVSQRDGSCCTLISIFEVYEHFGVVIVTACLNPSLSPTWACCTHPLPEKRLKEIAVRRCSFAVEASAAEFKSCTPIRRR